MTRDRPLVSVLMPCFNAEKYLSEAVKSILNQSYQDIEFLVCDDGSTDTSIEVLQSFSDSRLRITRNPENRGIVDTLNQLVGSSKGRYIARMDADDISETNRIELQVAFLEDHPEVVVVGTAVTILGTETVLAWPPTDEGIKSGLLFGSQLAHPTVMFATDKKNIYYRREFEWAEDYELWTRLAVLGSFANIDTPLLKYRRHGNQVTAKKQKVQATLTQKIQLAYQETFSMLSGVPETMINNLVLHPSAQSAESLLHEMLTISLYSDNCFAKEFMRSVSSSVTKGLDWKVNTSILGQLQKKAKKIFCR